MKFAHPEILFGLWMVPLIFLVMAYAMHRRRAILERYARPKGLAAIAGEAGTARRRIKAGLMLMVFALGVTALAGPQYGYHWEEVEQKGVDIIVALDCSRSMMAADIRPSRLERAKQEILDLLMMMKGDRVGLVAFAGNAFLQCPLTLDYDAFHLFLGALTPDFLPLGGTNIAAAIQTSLDAFDTEAKSEKAIILITDGESTGGDPLEKAAAAAKAGVKIFCIGIGQDQGAPIPEKDGGFMKDKSGKIILSRLDEETLKQVAVKTGGIYVRSVAGDMDLDVIYEKEIHGKMKAATLKSGKRQVWEERFQWFLALALAALTFEMFLSGVRKSSAAVLLLCTILLVGPGPARAASLHDSLRKGHEAYDKGDYDAALKHFIDAQLEAPERRDIYYNIGNAYYRSGNFDAAAQNYQKAAEAEDSTLKEKAIYNMGNAKYRLNHLKDAISDYEKALKIDPKDQQASQNLKFTKKMLLQKQQQKKQNQNQDQKDTSKEDQKKQEKKDNQQGQGQNQDQGKNQNQDQKRNQDKDQAKQKPDQGKSESSSQKEQEGKKPSPQQKNPDKQGGEDKGKPQSSNQPPPPEPQPEPSESQEKAQQPSGQAQQKDAGQDKSQAERVLNRLKDMPGRAMMPVYQGNKVEKDW